MRTIYKYPVMSASGTIVNNRVQTISGKVLSVQMQDGQITMWILGDSEELVWRTMRVVGTGWDTDVDGFEHRATVQVSGYVWHVFEKVEAA